MGGAIEALAPYIGVKHDNLRVRDGGLSQQHAVPLCLGLLSSLAHPRFYDSFFFETRCRPRAR